MDTCYKKRFLWYSTKKYKGISYSYQYEFWQYDGKDSIAGEKKRNFRWAHQVKIENSRFSIWTHENYHNENLKKTKREKSEVHMKISVRFLRYIAQVFPAVAAPAAAVVALAWRLNVAKCLRFRLHKQFVYIS